MGIKGQTVVYCDVIPIGENTHLLERFTRSLGMRKSNWRYGGRRGLFTNEGDVRLALLYPERAILRSPTSYYISGVTGSGQKVITSLDNATQWETRSEFEWRAKEKLHDVRGGLIHSVKNPNGSYTIELYHVSMPREFDIADPTEIAELLDLQGLRTVAKQGFLQGHED